MINKNDTNRRGNRKNTQESSFIKPQEFGMFIITDTVIKLAGTYRYKYTMKRAQLADASPYAVTAKSETQTHTGYSISEMTNATGKYAYGVPTTALIGTYLPIVIPVGTAVFAVSQYTDTGTQYWLIINTQAITGDCP